MGYAIEYNGAFMQSEDKKEDTTLEPETDHPTKDNEVDTETSGVSSSMGGMPYAIIDKLGSGGMGDVFLARQELPERLVALKLISRKRASKDYLARFEAEYQALAMMNHPRIAAVYDVGITPEGEPYFTMEYVPDAQAITRFCYRHELTLKQRLRLFLQVCDGVFHAHQHALVHRDLKPANVLVTDSGTAAAVKIIDFGIARRLNPHDGLDHETGSGRLIGTPAYMSPEQLMEGKLPITTQTDVYTLGLILYELLADQPPFDPEYLEQLPYDERLRLFRCEQAPPLSSRAIDHKRARTLRGDLDAVVAKALAKNCEHRYETVADLARDIGNVLDQKPVLARPPGLIYLLSRYVRRHRFQVITLAAVLLSILALSRAVWESNQKMTARESARGLNQLMEAVQWTPDPGYQDEVKELRILADLEAKIADWSGGPNALKAQTHNTLGEFYLVFGKYDQAAWHFQQALAIEVALSDDNNQQVALYRNNLSRAFRRSGKRSAAEKEARQALAWYQQQPESYKTASANTSVTLALSLPISTEGFAEAETLLTHAIQVLSENRGAAHQETLLAYSSYANLLLRQRKFEQAEEVYRQVLQQGRVVYGDSRPLMLAARKNLATALWQLGDLDEAEALFRQTIELRQFILPDEHRTITRSIYSLARVLSDAGKYKEAEDYFRIVVERSRSSQQTGYALDATNWLARALWLQDKRTEAIDCLEQAYQLGIPTMRVNSGTWGTSKNFDELTSITAS